MNIADILRNSAKVGGAALSGLAEDQKIGAARVLADAKAARDAQNDAILNKVRLAGIDPTLQGQLAGAKVEGETPAIVNRMKLTSPLEVLKARDTAAAVAPVHTQEAIDTAKGVAPVHTEQAIAAAAGTAPITQATHAANRDYDNDHPEPVKPGFTPVVTTAPGGEQHVSKFNTKTGQIDDTGAGAKATGSLAKLTGDQEKSYIYYNLMKNAEPSIAAALGTGRIRPAAVSAYLGANAVSDIPLLGKAIGVVAKPAANANLNDEEQQLIRAGKDFAAGVLRKESGAAVTNSELMEVMDRYFPGMFGDKPGLTGAKGEARAQYMKTMEQEAGPAIQFYGRQKGAGTPSPVAGDAEFDALLARYKKKP